MSEKKNSVNPILRDLGLENVFEKRKNKLKIDWGEISNLNQAIVSRVQENENTRELGVRLIIARGNY